MTHLGGRGKTTVEIITPQAAAVEILKRRKARESLLSFTEYTHRGWTKGAHQKRICDALERVERGDCNRLMIWSPPRHSKSEFASVRFPSWCIGRHPDWQIISASYGDMLASGFGGEVLNIIKSPEYAALFPGTTLRRDTQSKSEWRTNQGGVYHAAGIGGSTTGTGAHVFVIDDPLKNREEADSIAYREKLWRWYWGVARTRLMPGGRIVLMMTRWHEDDLAGRLLGSVAEPWEVLDLKAITMDEEGVERALWPEWYPIEEMSRLRSQLTEAGRSREWSAQYQQEPVAEEGSYFLREWFAERFAESELAA